MTVDTLRYAEELQRAGVAAEAAKVHAQALNRAVQDGVATKADVAAAKAELKGDIAELKAELKGDIAELKADIARLDSKIDNAVAALEMRVIRYMVVQAFGIVALLVAILRAMR